MIKHLALFFILFNFGTNKIYSQENGNYKSDYGFTLKIKNVKKNESFSFNLSAPINHDRCSCLDMEGEAIIDTNEDQIIGKIKYQNYIDHPNGVNEPYLNFYFSKDKIEVRFVENAEICGNCFEVDEIFHKVATSPSKKAPIKKKANSKK
jgi:hypothetical protein